jgi:beta-glucan synthesis-associated protein KRE6
MLHALLISVCDLANDLSRTFVQLHVNGPSKVACAEDPTCLKAAGVPLLKNIRRGLIDPDTPKFAMTRTSLRDGKTQKLVVGDKLAII